MRIVLTEKKYCVYTSRQKTQRNLKFEEKEVIIMMKLRNMLSVQSQNITSVRVTEAVRR